MVSLEWEAVNVCHTYPIYTTYDEIIEDALFHPNTLGMRGLSLCIPKDGLVDCWKGLFDSSQVTKYMQKETIPWILNIWWAIWKVKNNFISRKKSILPQKIIKILQSVYS